MNWAHVHLALNHLPVFGTMFGLLLLAFAFLRRSDELKRFSLGVFVIVALLTIPVYLTGEPAEELIETSAGVSEALIEQHENAAQLSLVFMEMTGAVALLGLFLALRSLKWARQSITATLLLAAVTVGLMARTANLGGEIRHPEIRATTLATPAQAEERENEKEH
jgi:hypothetical protein